MDEHIDQMVSKDIETAEIVIQSKGQAGYGPIKDGRVVAIRVKGSFQVEPGYFFEVQIGVMCYVWLVVKMPGTVKGISVYR